MEYSTSTIVFTTFVATLVAALAFLRKPKESAKKQVAKILRKRQEIGGNLLIKAKDTVLIIANPNSGSGKAVEFVDKVVLPTLKTLSVGTEVVETKGANHARKFIQNNDISKFRCIIICAGDGVLNEVINGMADRISHKQRNGSIAEQERIENKLRVLMSKVPIVIVPLGSSNGVAVSFGYKSPQSAFGAALCATCNASTTVDVMRVTLHEGRDQTDDTYLYGILHASVGAVADHDVLQEEKLRFLGPTLKDLLAPLYVILFPAVLRCVFSITATKNEEMSDVEKSKQHHKLTEEGFDSCRIVDGNRVYTTETDVYMLSCSNMRHGGGDIIFAPSCRRNEGTFDVLMIRNRAHQRWPPTRWSLLKVFLGLEQGTHVMLPNVEYYEAKELHIGIASTHAQLDKAHYRVVTVDGERMPTPKHGMTITSVKACANFVA